MRAAGEGPWLYLLDICASLVVFFLGGVVLVCGDRVSLDSPDSIDQIGLKPRGLPASASHVS